MTTKGDYDDLMIGAVIVVHIFMEGEAPFQAIWALGHGRATGVEDAERQHVDLTE